ncbi:hypothetical protein J3D43_002337 [Paenibacillus xylanexedens]|nr:hypothetical protein [Paenibacillus xylanexedens]MCP1423821.1 hypothetical protein [Paenibacillus xylanexedens]
MERNGYSLGVEDEQTGSRGRWNEERGDVGMPNKQTCHNIMLSGLLVFF